MGIAEVNCRRKVQIQESGRKKRENRKIESGMDDGHSSQILLLRFSRFLRLGSCPYGSGIDFNV